MSVPSFGSPCTLLVRRTGGRDGAGRILPHTEHTVTGCWWGSLDTDTVEASDVTSTGIKLGGPYDADLRSTDAARFIDGHHADMDGWWYIDGDIKRVKSPFTGWHPGFIALARRGER